MFESESNFNLGYEYLADTTLNALQQCLDSYVSGRSKNEIASAKKRFPQMLNAGMKYCNESPERARLMFQFLQTNIRLNYAGGIGKDINNSVVKAIAQANNDLADRYPELFNNQI